MIESQLGIHYEILDKIVVEQSYEHIESEICYSRNSPCIEHR